MSTIFTRVIDGEIPGRFVWRDETTVAFLPVALLAPGHTLVVPIAPVDHWIDLAPEANAHLWRVAQTISRALDKIYRPLKVGVLVVGEEVPHTHVHLVPFTDLAQMSFANVDSSPAAEVLDRQAEALRVGLRAAGHGEFVPSP
ncbi:MAG: HIT family protein [Acidimicrobiia bacterium]|nr:HIT family protein [Acidimicrobiia bacterium]